MFIEFYCGMLSKERLWQILCCIIFIGYQTHVLIPKEYWKCPDTGIISSLYWYRDRPDTVLQYSASTNIALYRYRTILLCIDTERYCSVSIQNDIALYRYCSVSIQNNTALYRYWTILLSIDSSLLWLVHYWRILCYMNWLLFYCAKYTNKNSFMFLLISTLAPKWCTKKLFSFLTVPRIKLLSY